MTVETLANSPAAATFTWNSGGTEPMMIVVNEVRAGFYLDSVALMRIARALRDVAGVEEAGLMIGTPANKEIMREARVLAPEGEKAGPGDLVIAVRASTKAAAEQAIAEARRQLDQPRRSVAGSVWQPRTLRAAVQQMPDANIALISVPGDFAAAEARNALRRGLNVMMFSDNVSVADEVALKREARELGLLVMGPDCGTAIIGGVPLAFANVVPRGDIGIIGASGTGIQEVSCLIAQAGRGISHAIGTGGRDLKTEVGASTTLMAIDAFDADPATKHVVLISKPPALDVAKAVLDRVGKSQKPFTVCFIGAGALELPANAKQAPNLADAAHFALGKTDGSIAMTLPKLPGRGRLVRALYCGGTLCAEAQFEFLRRDARVASNVPIPGASKLTAAKGTHTFVDLGDDDYTRGRPHPMIEPAVRDEPLAAALADPATGVVLLDVVLGWGGHMDPAGHLAATLKGRAQYGPAVIASVTGTEADPQVRSAQVAKLVAVGVSIAPSNAAAAQMAVACVTSS